MSAILIASLFTFFLLGFFNSGRKLIFFILSTIISIFSKTIPGLFGKILDAHMEVIKNLVPKQLLIKTLKEKKE